MPHPSTVALSLRARLAALKTVALRSLVRPARTPLVSPDNFAVAGLLESPTGLGQSARLCRDALGDAGCSVGLIDLCERFKVPGGVPVDIADRPPRPGPGTLIVHINAPQISRALQHIGRRLVRDKLIVGYWAWELETVPAAWLDGARYVHEVWTPSRFVAKAVSKAIDRTVCIVPHVLRAPPKPDTDEQAQSAAREALGLPRSAFVAAFAFAMLSNFERKNPLAAIAAFKHAFGRDPSVCLILRCLDLNAYPAGLARIKSDIAGFDNIRLYGNAGVSIGSFMRAADVYLSLHRSEGFGLTMLEAMAYARPVVATNWSGNTDFMAPEGCVSIRYGLIPVHDPQETYQVPDSLWAEPDVESAAAALCRLRDNPTLRLTMAAKARVNAEQFISYSRTALHAALIGQQQRATDGTAKNAASKGQR